MARSEFMQGFWVGAGVLAAIVAVGLVLRVIKI